MAYISSNKNQSWLMPLSIKDMIPKDHICFAVEEFVDSLDFSKFDLIYDGAGHPAYHPRLIMKILIHGMLGRERASRRLARACRENFVFMYLAEMASPDFRTIARFRHDNPQFIKSTFKNTVEFASKHNFIDLSFIAIDGSTIKASAGVKKYLDKKGLDRLDRAIDRMVEDDIALDKLEDEMFDGREDGLTGVDRKDLKRLVREYKRAKDKAQAKKKIKKAKNELEKYGLKKVSISDPDTRMMKNKHKVSELSYNSQISVSKNQIILSNDLCQDRHDANQLIPQIKNLKENIKLKRGTKVGVDSGYSSGENIMLAEGEKVDLYVPSRAQAQRLEGKEQTLNHDDYEYDRKSDKIIAKGKRLSYRGFYFRKNTSHKVLVYKSKDGTRKDVPEFFRERLRMKEKMETKEAAKTYEMRKITAEPVYGNLKANLGFKEFMLRGIEMAKTEFNLACIAHNLQKIWRLRAAKGC